MKKKRLLSCVLIVALLLSLCAIGVGAATVDDFTDVSPDDWYYDAVSEVAAAGYFNGTSATTFDPQLTMTRAMFVTVLARFDGATVDNSADTTFTDVPTGQYYTGAVAWAAENGLVQGYGGNAFGTSNPITRQDMAVLMTRYIAYYEAKNSVEATTSAKGSETTHDVVDDPADFADAASIAAYAAEAVVECANYGLLIGDENGNFRPTSASTRAEAATVISRLSWTVEEIDRLSSSSGGGGGGGSTYYFLKLDPNDGALDASVTVYETNDGVATIRKSSKNFKLSDYPATLSGYTLAGWNTSADGTGTAYAAADTYTSSATSKTSDKLETLYAQWTETDDYIGLAVEGAITNFNAEVTTVKDRLKTTNIDGTRYTYSDTVERLDVTADKSTWNVGDEDAGATREVTVAIDAAVDADSLETIARVAASMARDMVSGTAVSSLTAADLRSVVTEVVKQLEEATGLNLSLDVNTIVESLRGEGSSFWTESGIGDYVSSMTVTIKGGLTIPDAELEFTVDNGAVTLVKTDDETLRTAATACAKAAAYQLLASLEASLDGRTLSDKSENIENIDNFALSAEVGIGFTPNENYKDIVAPYAKDYTLKVTTSFDSNETILFAYSGDTFDVALNMANKEIAEKYKNGYANALGSATVKNRIATMVESMITSDSSEEGSGNVLSTINDILVEATKDSSGEESSAVSSAVTDAVTEWVVKNATNGSTEMDNSAIYSLVDTLAETTIGSTTVTSEYISNALMDSGVDESDAKVITTYVEKYQEAYAANGETLTEADIAEIKASVTDPTTGDDVDDVIDRLIDDYLDGDLDIALSVMEDGDADSWTALIAAAEAESGSTDVSMNDILTLLSDLGTVEGLRYCTVESLGNLLQSGLLDNYSGMVSTALNSISNINITTPASFDYAITIKSAKDANNTVELNSNMLTRITDSGNYIKELGTILTENFVNGETVADLILEVSVDYSPVSMKIDFSLYFG